MNYDDDTLDRALAALPLEEPPPGLHARIMAATVYRPEPVVRSWEVWAIGTLVAFGAWLCWVVATTPNVAERLTFAITRGLESSGLTSEYTLLWLAIGASAAWSISQLTIPTSRERIRIR